MKKRNYILNLFPVLCCLLLVACSNDDDEQVRYVAKNFQAKGEIKVYTEGGREIDDETTRNDFLEYFHQIGNGAKPFDDLQEESFRGMDLMEEEGVITKCASVDVIQNEEKNGAEIIRTTVKNEASRFDKMLFDSGVLKYDFYRPEENDKQYYHMQYVLHREKKQIGMSLISVKLVRWNEQEQKTEAIVDFAYNELNEEFPSTLGARDTLAVREYKLILSR